MATPINFTGFELGLSAYSTNGTGLVNTITGSPSISTTQKHSGSYAMRCNTTAATAYFQWTISTNRIVGRFWVYFTTKPGAAYSLLCSPAHLSGSLYPVIYYYPSTNKFGVGFNGAAYDQYSSGTVNTGQWYCIDYDCNVSINAFTIDWKVDGAAQTRATCAAGGTAYTATAHRLGACVAVTGDMYFDDMIYSYTSADYPILLNGVEGLRPGSDGTHNAGTNVIEDGDGNDIGVVTAYDHLNEDPWVSTAGGSALIKQVATGTGNYAEINFADTAQTNIIGVMGYLQYSASGTSSDEGGCIVRSNTTETTLWGNPTTRADYSESTSFYKRALVSPDGGTWSLSVVNALRCRMGYSNDINPVPYWQAVMIEVAYAQGGYALWTTTGTFALSGSNAIILVARKTYTTAGVFTLTGNNAKLQKGYPLKTTVGAFALGGNNAILLYKRLVKTTTGTYALAGSEILKQGRLVKTTAGAFTLSGSNAILARGYPLKTTAGAFTLSGSNAYLLIASKMYSTSGTFTWSGSNAILKSTHLVKTTTGGFAWVGNDAILTYVPVGGGAYLLQTTSGSFVWSGSNAYLRYYRKTFTTSGAFTWTGNNSVILAARKTFTTTGTYTLAGNNALLREGRLIKTTTGAITFTGNNAILVFVRKILSGAGVYTWTGNNVTLTYTSIAATYQLLVSKGIFILTGKDVIFYKFGNLPTIERTYIVPAEDRTFDVEYEDRTFEVAEEIRTIIETQNRTYLVEAENRIVEVDEMEDAREFEKGVGEILDYHEDWTTWLGADTIATSTWSVPAGITKASDSKTNTLATIWLTGGTLPEIYPCVNTITTAGGRTAVRTINIIMVPR